MLELSPVTDFTPRKVTAPPTPSSASAEPVNKFETHRRPSLARISDHPHDHRRVDPRGIRRRSDDRPAMDEPFRVLSVGA